MSATAVLTGVTLKQEYGIYTGLDATYTVKGITSSDVADAVVEALGTVGAYGTAFSNSSNLIIVEKTARLVSFANSTAKVFEVDVKYLPYGAIQDNWVWQWACS